MSAVMVLALLLAAAGCTSPSASGDEVRTRKGSEEAPAKGGATMNSVSLQFVEYRNDPAELAARVDRMLAEADPPAAGGDPVAVVVPHAGYRYSGPVAAQA